MPKRPDDHNRNPAARTEKAAFELRRQGATFTIISHTLGIPYRQAKALGKAYDRRVGHAPRLTRRNASEVHLAGYTVRDGRAARYAAEAPRAQNRTRISRKNQVTLPVAVLAAARLQPADRLLVEALGDGKILLRRDHDVLDDVIGSMPGLSAAANLEQLRDEWERP